MELPTDSNMKLNTGIDLAERAGFSACSQNAAPGNSGSRGDRDPVACLK
jgi:hypothetical protein